MSAERLTALREAATPGPWWDSEVLAAPGCHTVRSDQNRPIARITGINGFPGIENSNADANAALIVALVNATEQIVALMEAVEEANRLTATWVSQAVGSGREGYDLIPNSDAKWLAEGARERTQAAHDALKAKFAEVPPATYDAVASDKDIAEFVRARFPDVTHMVSLASPHPGCLPPVYGQNGRGGEWSIRIRRDPAPMAITVAEARFLIKEINTLPFPWSGNAAKDVSEVVRRVLAVIDRLDPL